jgi:cell pole-organizing protein PopZ
MSAANVPLATTSLDAERRAYEPSMEEILASIRKIIADDDSLPAMREAGRRPMEDIAKPIDQLAVPAQDKVAAAPEMNESFSSARDPAQVLAPRLDRWPPRALYRPESRSPSIPAAKDEPRSGGFDNWRSKSIAEELTTGTQNARSEARSSEMAKLKQPLNSNRDEADETELDHEASEHGAEESAPRSAAAPLEDAPAPASEAGRQPLVSPDAAASVAAHFQALAASMVINDSDLLQRYAEEMLRPMLKQWLDDNLPVLVEKLVRAEIERVARGRR